MPTYTQLQANLQAEPKTWLITGVAGFIGSNLLEALLKLNQRVVGLDNFATSATCQRWRSYRASRTETSTAYSQSP